MVDDTFFGRRVVPAGTQLETEIRTAGPTAGIVVTVSDIRARQITYPYAPREAQGQTHMDGTLGTASTTLANAAGAGIFRDITGILIDGASSIRARLSIKDGEGAATTAAWLTVESLAGLLHPTMITFPQPLKASAVNTPWLVNFDGLSTSTIMATTFHIDHT